jgi:hypothetical protein
MRQKSEHVKLLDNALAAQEGFEKDVMLHPLVQGNKALAGRAERINDELAEMYQEIGREFA